MRSFLQIVWALASYVCISAFAKDIQDSPVPIRTSFGSKNAVCKEASKILGELPRYRFWNGSWRDAFGSASWEKDTYPSTSAEGKHLEIEYEFRIVDINNDGQNEVVVKQTDMFRSAMLDWIYVLPVDEFQSLRESRRIRGVLDKSPQLNPRNFVTFTNKHEAVPTEMTIWSYGSRNLIVMRELSFSTGEEKPLASMYVAELRGSLAGTVDRFGDRRLIPNMVCRFKEK